MTEALRRSRGVRARGLLWEGFRVMKLTDEEIIVSVLVGIGLIFFILFVYWRPYGLADKLGHKAAEVRQQHQNTP